MCRTNRRDRAEIGRLVAERAAHRAFQAVGDEKRNALDTFDHRTSGNRNFGFFILRQCRFIIEEFTLEQSGNNRIIIDAEQNMAAARTNLHFALAVL